MERKGERGKDHAFFLLSIAASYDAEHGDLSAIAMLRRGNRASGLDDRGIEHAYQKTQNKAISA
jgi:hypothetical protein